LQNLSAQNSTTEENQKRIQCNFKSKR
jgi:hypothetical protein